jgi:DNA-binding NtrC family response regulator
MKLLILEDSTHLARAVQSSLMKDIPKLEVHTAETIAEAEDFLRYDYADVMIVDVNLPDGNGIDFLCDVRTAYPCIPAIVLTSNTQTAIRQRAENMALVQFLQKPVTIATLLEAVLEAQSYIQDTTKITRDELLYVMSHIPILDLLQIRCQAGKTTAIHITGEGGRRGKVCIDHGRITHAEAGNRVGVAALCEIIDWVNCEIIEDQDLPATETVRGDWMTAISTALCASEGQNESVTLAYR